LSEMRTVRGMRDLMGSEILVRDYLVDQAVQVFKGFGYEPLDSPVMELWETLSAKGGEDIEAETFKFTDKGNREVGLRFDLTVPLARIVASNPHLRKPFKRYAVGKAWRYDRPQAGRYREFMQADVDIIGASSAAADAEVVLVALEFARRVLQKDYVIRINNRKVLKGLTEAAGVKGELAYECFRSIDKLDKIGKKGVVNELLSRGISEGSAAVLLDALEIRGSGTSSLEAFSDLLKESKIGSEGVDELNLMAGIFQAAEVSESVMFDMSLARGFDYYTGPVFEGRYIGGPDVGSILGGGRYDQLIEKFGGQPTPATGISLGIDRFVDVLLAKGTAEELNQQIDVFLVPIKDTLMNVGMKIANQMIREGIDIEVDLIGRNLKKNLEHAESRGAKYVVIIGPRDLEKGEVSVRDMKSKETQSVKLEKVTEFVSKRLH
jgi:histidyl-tRNA synthetase